MSAAAFDLFVSLALGTVLGLGLWAMAAALPRWSAPSLVRRVAPYVRDVTDAAGTTLRAPVVTDPGSAILSAASAVAGGVRRLFERVVGGAEATSVRLSAAGSNLTVAAFRGRQLGIAIGGAALGAVVAAALSAAGRAGGSTVALPLVGGVVGVIACDAWLTTRVRQRRVRIQDELPTVLEFLTLCLAAGEGLTPSIRRASEVGSGALSGEFRRVALDVGTGSPLVEALEAMAVRVQVPAVRRAVEHLVAAVDRGAPLAAVLRDQAADAREEQKREMLEQAGRKEIQMMVPRTMAKTCCHSDGRR